PYSASKAAAELVTASYRQSFLADQGVGVATARAGNVLGGGDWTPHQLVPEVMSAFAEARPAELRQPESVRPWQHVLDALNGYLALAERLADDPEQFAGAWNFGPNTESVLTVSTVVDRLAELWGHGAGWEVGDNQFPHETSLLEIDSTKARSKLDWHPRLDLDSTLALVVDWYRAHRQGKDITRAQIASFLDE
ncbi:MAG: GDP-mannose 4,6-dehydratase, partial [Acidimicrobiia bacterium]